jgi:hypothetical protein
MDSLPESTATATADSLAGALRLNGRAELDATTRAVIATIIRITGTTDFDLITIRNSDRLTQKLTLHITLQVARFSCKSMLQLALQRLAVRDD